jgi:hypothetical protein
VGRDVCLYDKLDRNTFVFAQDDQPFEDFFPSRISGEVVVREEIQADAGLAVRLSNSIRYALWRPISAIVPLDVDDRAERAVERAPLRSYAKLTR